MKKGISLVILVITIVVMIILATAVILSIDGSDIIGKGRKSVDSYNVSIEEEFLENKIITYNGIIKRRGVTFIEHVNKDRFDIEDITTDNLKEIIDNFYVIRFVETDNVYVVDLKTGLCEFLEKNSGDINVAIGNKQFFITLNYIYNVDISNRSVSPLGNETDGKKYNGLEGEGNTASPYKITCIEDLIEYGKVLEQDIKNNGYATLSENLDFKEKESYKNAYKVYEEYGDLNGNGVIDCLMVECCAEKGFNPLANNTSAKVWFDGNNKKISNLYINRPDEDNIGLFKGIKFITNGYIKNLRMENVNITGGNNVGSILGLNSGSNTAITNCSASGTIIGKQYVGGLTGNITNSREIILKDCFNEAHVIGLSLGEENKNSYTGGLGGTSIIPTNCYNLGKIEGVNCVGGLVGTNDGNLLTNCYNKGEVIGDTSVGGLSGNYLTAKACYNEGKITGNSYVGGLTGNSNYADSVKYCYNKGQVIGKTDCVGGIIGWPYANSIAYVCNYNIGNVTSEKVCGGFSGTGWGFATEYCNYYLDTTYPSDKHGAARVTSQFMKSPEFISLTKIGTEDADGDGVLDEVDNTESMNYNYITNGFAEDDVPFVPDTTGINDGYPILYWQAK